MGLEVENVLSGVDQLAGVLLGYSSLVEAPVGYVTVPVEPEELVSPEPADVVAVPGEVYVSVKVDSPEPVVSDDGEPPVPVVHVEFPEVG